MNVRTPEGSLFRRPSAWIPIVMSLAALSFLLIYAAVSGTAFHAEERWPARIFQVAMLLELPISALFAIRWQPKQPRQSLIILAAQAIAWIIPIATVLFLENL